ncbi:diaminopimelate decarboxylase family protein [Streptosporangium sp. NPDC000396]|uniref:diaminopimelate decarboxylase family protein n=1 Tax=Streptosporangium sp. NPDC000396 TaxID=3366185 RepID=UPI00369A4561
MSESYDADAVALSDGMLRRESGRLLIEDVPVDALVERFSAPLFVLSESTLRRQARRIRAAFERAWPQGEVLVLPAVKANPVLALQRVLAQEGMGADLVGAGELEVAVRAGIDPALISLNGTGKDRATIERAVALGARVTIDDVREIELSVAAARTVGKQANLRIRLRPYYETDARMEAFGMPIADIYGTYKSGVPYDDLAEAGRALSAPELRVTGVMMHMGRYTTDLSVIGGFSRRFGELTAEVSDLWGGWTPDTIDVGGGFAPQVDGFGRANPSFVPPVPPSIEHYAEVVCENLAKGLASGGIGVEGRTLEVEPGRALFGPCGIHVATLLNVKRQTQPFPFTWYETDTTQLFLSEIPDQAGRPPVIPVRLPETETAVEVRVVGRSCMSDVLARTAMLPAMSAGDLLAFCFTGAYNDANASNLNLLPRPATVLVNGTQAHLVRRAESIEDLLARDTLPDYLHHTFTGAAR